MLEASFKNPKTTEANNAEKNVNYTKFCSQMLFPAAVA